MGPCVEVGLVGMQSNDWSSVSGMCWDKMHRRWWVHIQVEKLAQRYAMNHEACNSPDYCRTWRIFQEIPQFSSTKLRRPSELRRPSSSEQRLPVAGCVPGLFSALYSRLSPISIFLYGGCTKPLYVKFPPFSLYTISLHFIQIQIVRTIHFIPIHKQSRCPTAALTLQPHWPAPRKSIYTSDY